MPQSSSSSTPPAKNRKRWRWFIGGVLLICLGLPYGCSQLLLKEREVLFNLERGQAPWFTGLPPGMQTVDIPVPSTTGFTQHMHAWWWPASRQNAPTILYLHGTRWNLTAQVRRIAALHDMGFAVLAIDYRGFGESSGDLPSEGTLYEDAEIAWQRLMQLQPDPSRRYLYGHSLGGAVAIDLAAKIAQRQDAAGQSSKAAGLIVESTFPDLAAAAAAVSKTSLPIRWILSEKFDSIDKIADVGVPVLIVHGGADQYLPSAFGRALYAAAVDPKRLLIVPGGGHVDSMIVGNLAYTKAVQSLFAQTLHSSIR